MKIMAKQPKFNIEANVAKTSAIEQRTRATEQLPHPTPAETATPKKRRKRTIPRVDGMNIFFDAKLKDQLGLFSYTYKIDKSDIIRTAIREFFDRHTQETGTLDGDAIHAIHQYIEDTTE